MPVTAQMLRNVMAEARPIIERQMNDAKIIAGFRDLIASNGGDWSALKALIKAHVEDEADDDGEGKRVRKILDKADSSTAYADMLGLAKMNENNFSTRSYAEKEGRGAGERLIDAAREMRATVGAITIENTEQREVMDPVAVEAATEKQAAGTSRPTISNSQASPPPADSAGEAPSSSQASPATLSDDEPFQPPAFLERDYSDAGPIPDWMDRRAKCEVVEAV